MRPTPLSEKRKKSIAGMGEDIENSSVWMNTVSRGGVGQYKMDPSDRTF
jgi:hypothetical protein